MMLDQKCLVVVGGTSGLGLSAARAMIAAGARVVAVGMGQESVQHTNEVLGDDGCAVEADAREPGTATRAIETCVKTFGGFDGLYHVAGGSGRRFGDGPLHELTDEGWAATLDLNLTSVFHSNRAAVRFFLDHQTAGTLLNLGSALGTYPSPRHFSTHAYAAAKAAIIGFSRSIAATYAPHDIRVNVLCPGLVDTPMSRRASEDEQIQTFISRKQPLDGGRNGVPSDLDGAVVYFMSDASRFATGQVLYVDGGWNVTEGLAGEADV